MSHIGKKPITIPDNLDIDIQSEKIVVKGPKGELEEDLPDCLSVKEEDGKLHISVENSKIKRQHSLWGTYSRLITNMIKGVEQGYKKELEMKGVGYKANVKGDTLILSVGFSHKVNFDIPEGVEITAEKESITVKGIDKQKVNQTAAEIRKVREPEPYKGKGIRYKDEEIEKKPGKKAVSEEGMGA